MGLLWLLTIGDGSGTWYSIVIVLLAELLARTWSAAASFESEKIPSLRSCDWPKDKPVVPGLIFRKIGVASVGSLETS
ncbi:hypothetical protein BO82DRAFT_357957 [Aspergillus uvarum CBS 121591]|uniref:Uncharacterized protein n=1 Tax=Aspergillus uvarum CBS 121591 TaxID=1448315 RepID=A0A319C0I4_9EURO|nr:hypothetical protein BO82DRAFT_357957 [Aspergillus uvarum CBS 121591]PYH77831.1 hypothetical protein BO82DRAFT_357957 [Aspergillus uvarum CBS 121591]